MFIYLFYVIELFFTMRRVCLVQNLIYVFDTGLLWLTKAEMFVKMIKTQQNYYLPFIDKDKRDIHDQSNVWNNYSFLMVVKIQ